VFALATARQGAPTDARPTFEPQSQPSEPRAQGFRPGARSAKALSQASNFRTQGCRTRQAKPRNTERKPFRVARDTPGIVRKPLNVAPKVQRPETSRFGAPTARLTTLHPMPTTFDRRLSPPRARHRASRFGVSGLRARVETVASGSSSSAGRFSGADAHATRPPWLIRRMSPRPEAPHRHPNACPVPPTTMHPGRQETTPTTVDLPPCAPVRTQASHQAASP
jgi:hypothetical protein